MRANMSFTFQIAIALFAAIMYVAANSSSLENDVIDEAADFFSKRMTEVENDVIDEAADFFSKRMTEAENDVIEDAADFIETFKGMTDATADVLTRLEMIGSGSFSLLKYAGPVGQIIHLGLAVGLKKDSAELRAIQSLQRQITVQFDALSRKIDNSIARQQYFMSMGDYQKTVGFNIHSLEKLMDGAIAAPGKRSLEKTKMECEHGQHTPLKLLQWLNQITNLNCQLPSMNEAQTYAKAMAVNSQIKGMVEKESNGITNSTEFIAWRNDVIVRLMEMPSQMANKHLEFLETALNEYDALNFAQLKGIEDISQRLVNLFSANFELEYFHADVHRLGSESLFQCFMSTISARYQKKRVPLLEHSSIIATDLARLQLLGVMCEAFVSIDADESDIEFHQLQLREYDRLTKEIARALSTWINAELDSAWPDVILAHALLALEETKTTGDDVEENEYEALAFQIQLAANDRGQPKFLHQIVLSPPWEEDKYFLLKCKGDTCTRIYNKRGVNVAITRFDESEASLVRRLELSRAQILQHRATLQTAIKNQFYEYGGTSDLNLILSKSHLGQPFSFGNYLFGQAFWRNFVFLHNRKFFGKDCSIPIGLAGTMIEGMNAYDNDTEVFDDPLLTDSNRYKLILML